MLFSNLVLENLANRSPHQLRKLIQDVRKIMKSPILWPEDVSFLRLRMRMCRSDIYLNRQALANLELLMNRKAGSSLLYLRFFPATDALVSAYNTLTKNIVKDNHQLEQDEKELNAWLIRKELEKALPSFMAAWKAEKQRRYGVSFGSDVELGFDVLDALETSEPDDFELVDVVVVEVDGWQLVN
jgi:hypothetical protein